MTIGDVLLLCVGIFGSLTAAWAGAVLSAILFPERTHKASKDIEDHPWGTFFIGLGIIVPLSVLAFVLAAPPFSPLAVLLIISILAIASLGSGGMARLVARRIDDQGGAKSSYQAITRGAALIMVAEMLPVVGWMLVFPYVQIASFGAGVKSLFKKHVAITAPPTVETQ